MYFREVIYKFKKLSSIKTDLPVKSIGLIEFFITLIDFHPGCVFFIANIFHMAKKKDHTNNTENKDMLEYSEHMPLLRQIIQIIIRSDRVKERQRNTYD